MKALIAILILMGAFWVAKQLYLSYQSVEKHSSNSETPAAAQPGAAAAANLPGLPPSLESSLATAEKQGASGLRDWLANYRVYVKDPRLAAIELDYVVLISHVNPVEAKRIFKDVQDRTTLSSPIYPRLKQLEKTFD
jgi:hypothetical protein